MWPTPGSASETGIRGPGLGGLHVLAQDRPQNARPDQQAGRGRQAGSVHRHRQARTTQVPLAWSLVTTDRRRAPPRLHRHGSRDHHPRSSLPLLTSPRPGAAAAYTTLVSAETSVLCRNSQIAVVPPVLL